MTNVISYNFLYSDKTVINNCNLSINPKNKTRYLYSEQKSYNKKSEYNYY